MPNYTDNLGLIQPLGSEKIRIAQINQNMDTLDEAVGAVGDKSLQQQILDIGGGIAIMANGNTHPAITSGQFVFVRNHGTLADGAYTANSNIAENAALSSSNLTAVPGGGFNALKAGITSLSDQIPKKDTFSVTTGNFGEAQINSSRNIVSIVVGNMGNVAGIIYGASVKFVSIATMEAIANTLLTGEYSYYDA